MKVYVVEATKEENGEIYSWVIENSETVSLSHAINIANKYQNENVKTKIVVKVDTD